ncbi:MAG: flagellin [Balneolaceae bacterium]
MRVTNRIVFDNFMRDVNRNRTQMADIQSSLSSAKKVRFPSQDPISFQRSRSIEEDIRESNQFQKNINSGLRQSRLVQDSLDKSIDELIEIKRILVQSASDTYSAVDRANMADQISGIRDSLIATFNLSYGDRYLFAGTNSQDEPFSLDAAATGGVADTSNSTALKVAVDNGVEIEISVTGSEIRTTDEGDFFEIIQNIENALLNNDSDALNNLIPAADELIDHTTDVTSRLGNNIARMEYMFEQFENTKITQNAEISKLVDTDYAQAISELQRNETIYQSAMAVHTRMFSNSLLNYI